MICLNKYLEQKKTESAHRIDKISILEYYLNVKMDKQSIEKCTYQYINTDKAGRIFKPNMICLY